MLFNTSNEKNKAEASQPDKSKKEYTPKLIVKKAIPYKLDINSKYTSQSEAFLQLCLGNNVFLSGPAGSGKSYILNKYVELVQKLQPNLHIYRTSTTGLSALNIHGDTIHSYSGQGISSKPYSELKYHHYEFDALWYKSHQKIRKTDILIIDEISMFSAAQLTFLYERMHDLLGDDLDKVQIIVAGDFSQLPPVASTAAVKQYGQDLKNFCYKCDAWNKFHFINCYLDKLYRTSDIRLQTLLDDLADGKGQDAETTRLLRQLKRTTKTAEPGIPVLLSTNKQVNKMNTEMQDKNTGEKYFSSTDYYGIDMHMAHTIAKRAGFEDGLTVKIGDTIMITNNASEKAPYYDYDGDDDNRPILKNGMIGTITNVITKHNNIQSIVVNIELSGNEYTYTIDKTNNDIRDIDDSVIAGFNQFPIKIAYAISIHKSQGQTFTKIAVDLRHTWMPGLGYVALSRATNFDSITLFSKTPHSIAWNDTALKINTASLMIRKDLLRQALLLRKKYSYIYKIASNDIAFLINNRKQLNLFQLLTAAQDKMNNELKDIDYYLAMQPKIRK